MSVLNMLMGSAASDTYAWALTSALSQYRIWDPSRALRQDLDALEKLRHDVTVGHAVYYRKLMASGTQWYLEPSGRDRTDRQAAGLVRSWLDQLQGFTTLRFNLSEAVFAGSRWARVYLEEREITTPLGRSSWVVPVAAQDVDKRRLRQLRVEHAPSTVTRSWEDRAGAPVTQDLVKRNVTFPQQVWEPVQQRWTDAAAYDEDGGLWIHHVVDDTESSLGYGNGLADDLITYSWAKGKLLQYALNWGERWGEGGFIVAQVEAALQGTGTYQGKTYQERRDQLLAALKKMRSEHIFGIGKQDNVTILEPNPANVGFILELMRYLDSGMTRRILFADLPTGGGGGGGSLARAQEEGDSTEAAMLHDRALLDESITRDLVLALWDRNYDRLPPDLKTATPPKFSLRTRKKKDSSKRVDDVCKLLEHGIPLKREEVYEEIEFSMPTDEDTVFTAEDVPAIKAASEAAKQKQEPLAPGDVGERKVVGEGSPEDEAKAAEVELQKERAAVGSEA